MKLKGFLKILNNPILYIFGGEKAQGAEIVIERLLSCNKQYEPHLLLSPGKFATDLISSKKGYPVVTLPALKKLNRSKLNPLLYYIKAFQNYFIVSHTVLRYIRKNEISIIHANTIVPASYLLPALILSRLHRSKKTWLWSDHDMKYFSGVDALFSKICVKLYDKTLVVSNAVLQKYKSSPRLALLYNGLDLNVFRPNLLERAEFRKHFNIPANHVVLGIAASIHPDKGQLELAKVFSELLRDDSEITLLLAGSFSQEIENYSSLVKQYISKNKNIMHVGYIKEMDKFYNACDIIINNSNDERSESLGTTIYEGMACEKIVVASATGGTPEIITDEKDGFLFQPGNLIQLTKVLRYIITNYKHLETVRLMARKKVAAYFSIDQMTSTYNSIIIGLIENGKVR